MEMTKVQADVALVDRLQRIKNGANCHAINTLLDRYYRYIEDANIAVNEGSRSEYLELTKKIQKHENRMREDVYIETHRKKLFDEQVLSVANKGGVPPVK